MSLEGTSIFRAGPYSAESVTEAAVEMRGALGRPAGIVFAFVSSGYLEHLEEFCEILRVDGHAVDVVGSTGYGLIATGREHEQAEGFSLMALAADPADVEVHFLAAEELDELDESGHWVHGAARREVNAWIALIDPYQFPADEWLQAWNRRFPQTLTMGGLASGEGEGDSVAVFHNGKLAPGAVLTGISGRLKVLPVVSQGCRPIGEPLTVTRAESNVIYALGSQPAYAALESAFQTLSEKEKSTAKGNLFAGLASSEYLEDFKSGDFLIRNIIGADPNSGAVVIGGIPRIGQTLQYQFRDRAAAERDLEEILAAAASGVPGRVAGGLLFTCNGRGKRFFGSENHDASSVERFFGHHPLAGFFCNGEIGPVNTINSINAYSVSLALFFEDT